MSRDLDVPGLVCDPPPARLVPRLFTSLQSNLQAQKSDEERRPPFFEEPKMSIVTSAESDADCVEADFTEGCTDHPLIRDARLSTFGNPDMLPDCPEVTKRLLNSHRIELIRSFPLGPEGTNIQRASELWLRKNGIEAKSVTQLCATPEAAIEEARRVQNSGELAVFWTCAVFLREHQVFFRNPDLYPFFSQVTMQLDDMQLSTRPEVCGQIIGSQVPDHWTVLSHPSPLPLLENVPVAIELANSNADAAVRCRNGEAEACITTQSACKINGLVTLHRFGRPNMVFFAGITQHGASLLNQILMEESSNVH